MRATVFLILCAAIAGGCDNVTYVGTDEGGWTETPRILGAQPAELLEPGNTGIGVKPEYVRNLK